jgi:hypothetical protein
MSKKSNALVKKLDVLYEKIEEVDGIKTACMVFTDDVGYTDNPKINPSINKVLRAMEDFETEISDYLGTLQDEYAELEDKLAELEEED